MNIKSSDEHIEFAKIRIFISYSHKNRNICDEIAGILEDKTLFDVWYDKGLIPGEVYRKKIVETIKACNYFIVLISNDSVESEWVLDEVEYAKKMHKKILPIWIEKTEISDDLDMILQRYHSLFWYLRSSDTHFKKSLIGSVSEKEKITQGQSTVGFGNEFSESVNLKMKELLVKEQQGKYAECYDAENACILGMAYLFGGPCDIDRQKAKHYFKIAEYFGNPDGRFYQLEMQLEDRKTEIWDDPEPEFYEPIVEEIRQIADQGSTYAKLYMGNLYWYGRLGCPKNMVKSAQMYEACAKVGNARAQYMMAANYYFGEGVPKDYEIAKMYANLAMEQKYFKAWRRWGKFYRDGLAVPRDFNKAREYYEKGAKMGDYNCYNKVGDMLYYGWGFPVDYQEAVKYYRKGEQAPSCGQKYGLWKAKQALGRCYEFGHGVEKDLSIATEKYLEGYDYGSEECKVAYIRCSSQIKEQQAGEHRI